MSVSNAGRVIRRPSSAVRSVQELDLSLRLRAETVLSRMPLPGGGRVADLGCGTGCFSAALARRGFQVLCVDVSRANLDALGRIYGDLVEQGLMTPVEGDLTAIPLESGSLDGVICMEVLEHVRDDRRALAEMHRVLKPEAILVLSVPNRDAPPPLLERLRLESVHDRAGEEQHVRPGYALDELTSLLEDAGFRVLREAGVGGPLYRLTAGVVSALHLAYRRERGQMAWTWADVEHDVRSLPLRAYARVFPALLFLARIHAGRDRGTRSSLLVAAGKAA